MTAELRFLVFLGALGIGTLYLNVPNRYITEPDSDPQQGRRWPPLPLLAVRLCPHRPRGYRFRLRRALDGGQRQAPRVHERCTSRLASAPGHVDSRECAKSGWRTIGAVRPVTAFRSEERRV